MAMATAASAVTPDGSLWRPEGEDASTSLTVTALLVVQDLANPLLGRTLDALASQDEAPQRLVVVDATVDQGVRAWADRVAGEPWRLAFPDVSVVVVPAGAPFAEIIDTAVEALPGPGEDLVVTRRPRRRARQRSAKVRDRHDWFWLLHEDSAPDPGALRALIAVAGRSERIGVAGCKVLESGRPGHLVNVGLDLTRTGRHIGRHMEGEPDQGQHDTRHDVLAVSSAGLLVRRDVYLSLGGFEPAFDGEGDGLDLCWRTHLLGHQVVVVPDARVHQELSDPAAGRTMQRAGRHDADRPSPRSGRTLRRHRQVALARCSALMWPLMALWIAVSCTVMALVMLLLKRPRRAVAEFAQATAPLGIFRVLAARHRFGRRGRTRRRHLSALFVGAGAAMGDAIDATRSALTPERDLDVVSTGAHPSVARRGPGAGVRFLTNPGLWLTLLLTAVTVVRWRPMIGSGALQGRAQGFTGGELLPFATDSEGIWRLWRDRWSGAGLGELNPEHPFLPVLAGLARVAEVFPWVDDRASGATVVAWLLVAAVPLSGIAAYLAGRAATKAPWPRAAAGLAWAGLSTLSTATAQGRIGPVVAHILLPLVVAGMFTVARRHAGMPSTFGTVLAAALLGAFSPLLLALTSLVALGVVLLSRGWARARGFVVAVGPWVVLGPFTAVRLLDEPRALLAGPGGLTAAAPAEPWQLLLLHPGGPGAYPSWWTAPLLAIGVLALGVRARGRGRVLFGLALTAILGLAAGLAASRVTVTALDGHVRTPWAGAPLDLAGAAVLGLALFALGDSFRRTRLPKKLAARTIAVGALSVTLLGAVAIAGVTAWKQPLRTLTTAPEPVPAVAAHMADGSRATRMLTLTVEPDGGVGYRVDGRETSLPATDLDVPRAADPLVADAVRSLLAPGGGSDAQQRLGALGIGFVGLSGASDEREPVARNLAGVEGLSPMANGRALALWRVQPQPATVPLSRLRITVDGVPVAALATKAPNGRTTTRIPAGPANRTLTVAQAPGWGTLAQVTLNDRPLRRVAGATPTYALPASGGDLEVAPAVAYPRWRWLQLAALGISVFLAVPLGNARSRRRA